MKRVLAFFDFDGTMIKGNSLPRFLWYYSNPLMFIARSMRLLPVLMKYVMGSIDAQSAKEKVFICFFAGVKQAEFMEKACLFSRSVITSLLNREAVQRLQWHLENDHICVLVSASIEEYLEPWAESAGFSNVLATNLEVDKSGHITGRFLQNNCKGPEKVFRIKKKYGNLKDYEIYAYGDSPGDEQLLKLADHPYYRSFKEERAYPE